MKVTPPHSRGRVAVVCAIGFSINALLRPQIDAMSEAGYDVFAVCSDDEDVPPVRASGLSVHTVQILRRIAPVQDLLAIWKLYRLFRNQRVDIVHTHTPKAAFLGQVAATLARVRLRVNTVHGLYYLAAPPGLQRRLFKSLEVIACRLAHHVFSQSREDLDLIRDEELLDAKRLEFLGNGISLRRFTPAGTKPDLRRRIRDEIGVPPGAFVVGIVARMVKEKGFCELFEAFAKFRAVAPDAYLLHLGFVDDSRRDDVSPELANYYRIADRCRFLGQRDDVADVMTAMDVFCLPSYREGYPRSVIEASAVGLPVIASDIRGCREAVIDGVNGLLVPVHEVDPLVAALRRLYEDDGLRRSLGEGGVRRAREEFDERIVIEKVLAAYDRLLLPPTS